MNTTADHSIEGAVKLDWTNKNADGGMRNSYIKKIEKSLNKENACIYDPFSYHLL